MSGGSKAPATTTTKTEPPAYQLPYLQGALPAAQQLYQNGGPQQYGGNTITPFSSQSEQAMQGIQDRALGGSSLVNNATNFVNQGLMSGPDANPYAKTAYNAGSNPYGAAHNPQLDATFQHAADQTRGQLQSEYAGQGRNIGASKPVRSEELQGLATGIYGPAFEAERNRQLQYGMQGRDLNANAALAGQQVGANSFDMGQNRQMGLLSSVLPLANQKYADMNQLMGVGGQVEGKTGEILDDRVNRWNYEQAMPGQNYDQYLARISGQQGQSQTQTGPKPKSNAIGGALGGAAAGFSMGGPWGAAIGGGLGLLGGLM